MVSKGYPIGSFKGKKFVASHGMAMWRNFQPEFSEEINHEEALNFLACRDVRRNSTLSEKVAVEYKGFRLGFGRSESSRLVSRYPKNYRILKIPESVYSKLVTSLGSTLSVK
jgi:NOL1/NOP2/fmu family ribosome biogenesis protein